jgi:hypothetical protein
MKVVRLSAEERAFLVEYVFRDGNRYTDLVQEQFAEYFPETPVPHRNAVRKLVEKFPETSPVLGAEQSGRPSKLNDKRFMDISDSTLRVQACIDARGHHFQHVVQVHSDFPKADLQKVLANIIKPVQAGTDTRGHHFQHLL